MAYNHLPGRRHFTAFRSAAEEVAAAKAQRDVRTEPGISDTPNPTMASGLSLTSTESADLARKILAHERILQALIRHIAEEQPEVLARLKKTFGSSHDLGEYEQDHTSTRQYEDQFIQAVQSAVERGSDRR